MKKLIKVDENGLEINWNFGKSRRKLSKSGQKLGKNKMHENWPKNLKKN